MILLDLEQNFKDRLSCLEHPLTNKAIVFDTQDWQRYDCPFAPRGNKNVAYKAHSDRHPCLKIQCHKCHAKPITFKFDDKSYDKLTPQQRQAVQREAELKKAEQAKQREAALKAMRAQWDSARPCTSHPYFSKKQVEITETDGFRLDKRGQILCPVKSITGELLSTQAIPFKGKKKFYYGVSTKNGFHVFGSIETSDTIFLGEGNATCLTIRKAVQQSTVCVYGKRFSDIAPIIAKAYLNKQFIFCCDVPSKGEKVTSEDDAKKAIALVGGSYVLPNFSMIPESLSPEISRSDFNDLYCLLVKNGKTQAGALDEVRRQLSIKQDADMISNKVSNTKQQHANDQIKDQETDQETPLPENFKLTDTGLIYEKYDKDGKLIETTPITKRHIKILGRHSDYYSGENFGLLLELEDENEKKKKWAMPATLMSDTKALENALNYRGCYIYDIRTLVKFFKTSITLTSFIGVSRIGWHVIHKVRYFILPELAIGKGVDKEKIKYQTAETNNPFQQKGTLEEWREHVGKFLKGQSRLLFGVTFALSSLLLDIVGAENGGVHCFGSSSKGKTTILIVSASLFGDPEKYKLSWRTTPNAPERLAVSRHDLPFIIDESSEFGNEHNKRLASVIYMMMNGVGKSRLNSDSSLKDFLTWRCNVLSSGENPISQLLINAGESDNEGVAVRMIDLPAIVGEHGVFDFIPTQFKNGHEFSEYLKKATNKYHGTILLAFLNLLINEKPEDICAAVKSIEEKIISSLEGVEGQVMRCVKRFALAACAGELSHDLLGIEKGEATRAAIICLKAWIKARGGVKDNEATKLLKQVTAYRDAHNAMFKTIGDDSVYEKDNQAGYKEMKDGRWVHYATSNTFKAMIKPYPHDFAIDTFLKAKFITEDEMKTGNKRYLRQKKIEGTNSRFYHFDGDLWNVEEPEEVTK